MADTTAEERLLVLRGQGPAPDRPQGRGMIPPHIPTAPLE